MIAELAQRARVPQRIARGELLYGMTCEAWRQLNTEEAARFDRSYALFESATNITIEHAIDLEQRGVTPESLSAHLAERDAAAQRREKDRQLRAARQIVPDTAVHEFRRNLIAKKTRLAVVLCDRVLADRLTHVEGLSLRFAEAGDVPALDVVALGALKAWEELRPLATFDKHLLASPSPVHPQPSRRIAADPRPFLVHVGQRLTLTLRNGIIVPVRVTAVGPYDLIVGDEPDRILVPLHALAAWAPTQ